MEKKTNDYGKIAKVVNDLYDKYSAFLDGIEPALIEEDNDTLIGIGIEFKKLFKLVGIK